MPITITGGSPISGRADARLGAFAAGMAGTFTEAPARAGSMNPTLGSFGASMEGLFAADSTRDGALATALADFTMGFAGTSVAPNTTTWLPIEDTLPPGTQRNMLNYLSDPAGNIPAGGTFVDGVLSGGATYDPATGILTYGTTSLSGIRMGANDGVTATETVTSVAELISAINNANSAGGSKEILVADGTYLLGSALPQITAPTITVRGQSGVRTAVIIRGDAMAGDAAVTNIFTTRANQTSIRDLTLRLCRNHLIQVKAEAAASSFLLDNCVLQDGFEQFLKVSDDGSANYSDDGIVQDCLFEYTTPALFYYSGGIDAHHSRSWTVRRNTFKGFQAPAGSIGAMEHAIHFWDNSANITTERNTVIDCDRGIGYGLSTGEGVAGGIIRNNMVARVTPGTFNDVGIGIADCTDVECYNNTVYLADQGFVAIDYRYATSSGLLIANNLTNDSIAPRDGATATLTTNVTNAQASWFVNPANGDLRLAQNVATVVDQGTAIAGLSEDIDGETRPKGNGVDIGADESDYSQSAAFTSPLDIPSIWSWVDANEPEANLTFGSYAGYTNIATMQDLANPGNPFYNTDQDIYGAVGAPRPGYSPGGVDAGGYLTALIPAGVHQIHNLDGSTTNVFGQYFYQSTRLNAAGPFYCIAAIVDTREAGDRYLLGNDSQGYIRWGQIDGSEHISIRIAGQTEQQICADGFVPAGASIVEVWRDASNAVHCAVNGVEDTTNNRTIAGTFGLKGYGGGASLGTSSALDDYLLTYAVCSDDLDAATRQQMREFINARWGIY